MKLSKRFIMTLLLSSMALTTLFLAMNQKEDAEAKETVKEKENIYLAIGESYVLAEGEYENGSEEIVRLEDDVVSGISAGTALVSSDAIEYTIRVSDLYTVEKLDMHKPYLKDGTYSYQDNVDLDEALSYLINKKGFKSRAAAVEAVRFLTLRFPYKLHYFYENGRLDEQAEYHVDGEGRYYHQGLYLSKEKYAAISVSENGPAYWGKSIYEDYNSEYQDNGLDCSGFITWALYNAGYDVGDIGAGPDDEVYDLSDLGKKVLLEDVKMNGIKVGDLLGLDGHIGMIIGLDGEKIYVGEAYWVNDLQVRVYTYEEFLNDSEWEYVLLMDSFYGADGDLSEMWN